MGFSFSINGWHFRGNLGKGGGGHTKRVRDKGVHLYKGMNMHSAAYEL